VSTLIDKYPDDIPLGVLEMTPSEYKSKIMKDDSWGGEIELFILSKHYKMEIVALNAKTGKCTR